MIDRRAFLLSSSGAAAGSFLVAESFFSSLKKERIKKQMYRTRELATTAVAGYIDTFCNRTRRHSHLGGVSPEQCEAAHRPKKPSLH